MKKIVFYLFFMAAVAFGIAFHLTSALHPRHSPTAAPPPPLRDSEQTTEKVVTVKQDSMEERSNRGDLPRATAAREKKCACCRETSLRVKGIVKQKQREMERWALEMINTYGYEEGMQRVTAKSPTLAKRVQLLLEKEKLSEKTHAISQQTAAPTD